MAVALPLPHLDHLGVGRRWRGLERTVNAKLRRAHEALETIVHDRPLTQVEVFQVSRSADNPDIAHWFGQQGPHEPKRLRAGLYAAEISDSGSPHARESLGVSHLVGIEAGDDGHGWLPGRGYTSCVVRCREEQVSDVVHDVMLDIAMFHSWPQLRELVPGPRSAAAFSESKVAFARKQGLRPYFGDLSAEAGVAYVSLASTARGDDGIDFRAYEDTWRSFLEWWDGKGDFTLDDLATPPELEEQIRSIPKMWGLLPRDEVAAAAAKVKDRRAVLVVGRKRPSDKTVRSAMAQYFASPDWRQNMWRVWTESEWRSKTPTTLDPFVSVKVLLRPEERKTDG